MDEPPPTAPKTCSITAALSAPLTTLLSFKGKGIRKETNQPVKKKAAPIPQRVSTLLSKAQTSDHILNPYFPPNNQTQDTQAEEQPHHQHNHLQAILETQIEREQRQSEERMQKRAKIIHLIISVFKDTFSYI